MQAQAAAPSFVPPPPLWPAPRPLTTRPARRFQAGDRIAPGLTACEPLPAPGRMERWLAWSTPLWSRVAVELPPEEAMEDLRMVRALAREARALRRLNHPGVPRLLEDAHDEPVPHLVLEHVGGRPLAELLAEHGPLPPADVVHVGVGLASCLRHLHGRGLVHLGLAPSAIALRDGQVVLLDLGDARAPGAPRPRSRPRGPYHAPERCLGARPHPRMDVFSLGAVLYELATGQPPFQLEEAVPGCEQAQVLVTPVRARRLRRRLPPELDAAIHALLERDPRRRPRTADDAVALLAPVVPCS